MITEDAILEAIRAHAVAATYVIANRLQTASKTPRRETAKVLRILKRMERQGKVRRVPRYTCPNSITWEIVPAST